MEPTPSTRWQEGKVFAEVSLRVSFGGMTEARRSQVLDEVFGAS